MDNGLEDLGDLTISSGLTALTCINPDNLMRSKFSVFQDTITYYFFHQTHLLFTLFCATCITTCTLFLFVCNFKERGAELLRRIAM